MPRNRTLIIEPGTNIDLRNGARFVSYSPVHMKGNKDHPISFYSSDSKGGGVVFLPDGGEVNIDHARFSNLTSGKGSSWTLTGAVTIYEAKVNISNSVFTKNRCEDGLNLIRCDFEMNQSEISHTTSDGFDADFCIGTLSNSSFFNTGNDCIDFSGSTIKIESCSIDGSGDKGISGGESSNLIVKDCKIKSASIGIASKDNSTVSVSGTSINSCDFAFAAYMKKAEFGPALIDVKSTELKNIGTPNLIELNSKVLMNGKEYLGEKRFDIDSMYMSFSQK